MELELAKLIFKEVEGGGYLDPDEYPETDEEIIESAEKFAKYAKEEYNNGWGKNNKTIKSIVNLLSASEEVDKVPSETAQEDQGDGTTSSAFFRGMSESDLFQEIPLHIHDLSDVEVRRYHGIFNHYYARARYALADETASLNAAEHLRDAAMRKALSDASEINILNETKKPATVLTAEASLNEDYIEWDEKTREHEQNVIRLKALVDIYGKNVDVLSREATIRQNEFERSR